VYTQKNVLTAEYLPRALDYNNIFIIFIIIIFIYYFVLDCPHVIAILSGCIKKKTCLVDNRCAYLNCRALFKLFTKSFPGKI
jgi:hypothetical protein